MAGDIQVSETQEGVIFLCATIAELLVAFVFASSGYFGTAIVAETLSVGCEVYIIGYLRPFRRIAFMRFAISVILILYWIAQAAALMVAHSVHAR